MSRLLTFSFIAVTISGCATPGVVRIPPAYFAEGAAPLNSGQIAITAVGGGGYEVTRAVGGGGSLRVRVGVGHRQEVGLEGGGIVASSPARTCWVPDCRPAENSDVTTANYHGRLSWKVQTSPHLAVIAGIGGAYSDRISGDAGSSERVTYYRGLSLAGDLAALVSWGREDSLVNGYGGARIAFGGPLQSASNPGFSDGLNAVFTGAVGLQLRPTRILHLYLEGGPRVSYSPGVEFGLGLQALAGIGIVL